LTQRFPVLLRQRFHRAISMVHRPPGWAGGVTMNGARTHDRTRFALFVAENTPRLEPADR